MALQLKQNYNGIQMRYQRDKLHGALQPWGKAPHLAGVRRIRKVPKGGGFCSRSGCGPAACAGRMEWRSPFQQRAPTAGSSSPDLVVVRAPGFCRLGDWIVSTADLQNQSGTLEHRYKAET